MPIWIGKSGPVLWSVHLDEVSKTDWAEYVGGVRSQVEALHAANARGALLTISWESSVPDANQRRLLAETIRDTHSWRLAVHGFVSDSVLARGALTAVAWLTKKPYEERAFGDALEAMTWIASSVEGVDVRAIVRDIKQGVPGRRWERIHGLSGA